VYCVEGHAIDHIIVRTRDGGCTHNHGEFPPGSVSAPVAMLENKLVAHKSVNSVARESMFLLPQSVISNASDDILTPVPDGVNGWSIMPTVAVDSQSRIPLHSLTLEDFVPTVL
jgi:hypothetical protein